MVVAQETEDRMKASEVKREGEQIIKEELEQSSEQQNESIIDVDATESISRVHEHFREVAKVASGNSSAAASTSDQSAAPVPLRQMQGRKRKRQLKADDRETMQRSSTHRHDYTTSLPRLDHKIMQGVKRKNQCDDDEESHYHQNKNASHHEEGDAPKSFRYNLSLY